jgi:hypothetical protein
VGFSRGVWAAELRGQTHRIANAAQMEAVLRGKAQRAGREPVVLPSDAQKYYPCNQKDTLVFIGN